jgi:YbbR domain-containing protein
MKSLFNTLMEFIKASARRPTRTQWLRFGISFALAVLFWGWVTQLQDPYTTRTFNEIPIERGELPETLQVVSSLPNASVTIKGAESRVSPVRQSDISVNLDTSGITRPGTFRVPLTAEGADVNEQSVEPREVTIQVDERVTEIFPLRPTIPSTTDQTRTVSSVEPAVSQVTVTGPTTAVERIVEVVLPVTIEGQTQSYDAVFAPYAIDSSGQRVSEVEILPDTIMTHVELQTRGKAVSVIASISGVPAEGYTVQQRRALPDTIVVDGPEELLNDLLFVNTDPVDVTDATQSISTRVGLADLPEGVTILDPASGSVEVRVAIEDTSTSSQTLTELPVEPVGLGEGLTATFDPGTLSIQVSAPVDILQAMTPEDIIVRVDLTGLGPGTYRLTPEVTVPQGTTWLGGGTTEVTVTIEAGESTPIGATPEATPES